LEVDLKVLQLNS